MPRSEFEQEGPLTDRDPVPGSQKDSADWAIEGSVDSSVGNFYPLRCQVLALVSFRISGLKPVSKRLPKNLRQVCAVGICLVFVSGFFDPSPVSVERGFGESCIWCKLSASLSSGSSLPVSWFSVCESRAFSNRTLDEHKVCSKATEVEREAAAAAAACRRGFRHQMTASVAAVVALCHVYYIITYAFFSFLFIFDFVRTKKKIEKE